MLFSKDSHGYVYKWTELSTGKWYIGSRSAKNCHVNDGYTCSSKLVKQLILENSNNWSREILWVGDRQSAVQIESLILQLLNAAKDPDSYNQSNANGKFYTSGMVAHNRGKLHSEESKRKMSEKRSNPSLETRNKISATVVGRKKSIDHCKNLTLAMLNREKKECVHCNKLVDAMNYSKWHGDNCKIINPSRPGNINLIGSKRSLETREKMSVKIKNRIKVKCVHCSKIINQAAHTRYHGDKCKLNTINTI